jgi:hypothetical protein
VKILLTRWILGLVVLLTFAAAASSPAEAQVVVKVGPTHRHYDHRYYYHHRYYHHVSYRHGHRYYW